MPKRPLLNTPRLAFLCLLCLLGLVIPTSTGAQPVATKTIAVAVHIEVELEGVVTSIIDRGPTTEIDVLGVRVTIDDKTIIETPSAQISRGDLLGAPLPGRSVPGFWFGTAIVLGEAHDDEIYADILLIEPSESVLGGPSTEAHDLGGPSILGVPIIILDDDRLPGIAMNELGFEIDPATIEVGVFTVAEGYMGDDGIFYAHLVEGLGVIVGPPDQTSITRARCSQSADIDVRGGSTSPEGTATLFDDDTGELLAQVPIEPHADLPGLGKYRFDLKLPECPRRVRVENSNNSTATADVVRN